MDFIISCFNHPIINDIKDTEDKKIFIDIIQNKYNLTFNELFVFCTTYNIDNNNFINIINMIECWQFKYKENVLNTLNFDTFDKYFNDLPYDFKYNIFDNNNKYLKYCIINNENDINRITKYSKKLIININKQLSLPNSVTHLTFGAKYNLPDSIIPNSVTHLTFGNDYNQPTIIPNSVTHLTFGDDYNQSTIIPNSVIHLILGFDYDKHITIPNSVTHLTFNKYSKYNQPDTIIPNSITHLTFGICYNQKTKIPDSVTHLIFGEYYNKLTKLPKTIISHNLKDRLILKNRILKL
jgi:hypothetical protein